MDENFWITADLRYSEVMLMSNALCENIVEDNLQSVA